MRLLCDLQLSFIDKASKLFKVENDSNFNFMKNALKGISLLDNFDLSIMVPSSDTMETSIYSIAGQLPKGTQIYPVHYLNDYVESRFNSPVDDLIEIVDLERPDVIWTNDFSRVKYYRLLQRRLNRIFKIVAYNHWIDNPIYRKIEDDYTYIFRQAEGAYHADLIMFNTNYGSNFFLNGLRCYFTEAFVHNMSIKTMSIPPLLDIGYLSSLASGKKKDSVIVYNHRLSSLPYYKNSFDNFLKACEFLNGKGRKFIVLCTNPSGYALSGLPKYITVCNYANYAEYIREISQCKIGAAFFFEGHGQWSMSLSELAALGIPFVLPNMFGYPALVPTNYPYLCGSVEEGIARIDDLFSCSSEVYAEVSAALINHAKTNFSIADGMKEFLRWCFKNVE